MNLCSDKKPRLYVKSTRDAALLSDRPTRKNRLDILCPKGGLRHNELQKLCCRPRASAPAAHLWVKRSLRMNSGSGAAQAVERAELTQSLLERKNSVRLKQVEPRTVRVGIQTIKLIALLIEIPGPGELKDKPAAALSAEEQGNPERWTGLAFIGCGRAICPLNHVAISLYTRTSLGECKATRRERRR